MAEGHQTGTGTSRGPARGKCHRGGSSSARKSFPLLFCLPNYIIEKATQQGMPGGRPGVLWQRQQRANEVNSHRGPGDRDPD